MKRVACVLLIACGRGGFTPAVDSTPPSARSTLLLKIDTGGQTLADFPLLVRLDDTRAGRDLLDDTASNLRFFDSDGNVLAHEIDQLGTAGPSGPPLLAWVRVPAIVGATTTISVQIGGALPPPSSQSVWSSDYVAVYHLTDGHDSTDNHHDATPQGSPAATSYPDCAIGSCQHLGGSGDFFTIPDAPPLGIAAPTLEGWIYQRASAPEMAMVSRQSNGSGQDFLLGTDVNEPFGSVLTAASNYQVSATTSITFGTWTHIALRCDGTNMTLFVDGMQAAQAAAGASVEHDPQTILLGAAAGISADLDGMLDEIRIEQAPHSGEWMYYENQAMLDDAITYGPVER